MFLVVLRRAISNQPSVTAAQASVGVWTNTAMRSPAPENKATPTVVRPQQTQRAHQDMHTPTNRAQKNKEFGCVVFALIDSHLSSCLSKLVLWSRWTAVHLSFSPFVICCTQARLQNLSSKHTCETSQLQFSSFSLLDIWSLPLLIFAGIYASGII